MSNAIDEALDSRLLHRMLFFTDAVFAIVLTLLALELKAPETLAEANAETLARTAGHIGAFAFSFAIISVFWMAHMNTTRRLIRFDWPTAFANLVYLLPICLLPFATAWLGVSISDSFVWGLYCTVLVTISAAGIVLVLTAYRGAGKLVGGDPTGRERGYRLLRAAAPGIAFSAGLLGLAVGQSILAHLCWALIPIVFWVAARVLGPGRKARREVEVEAA
ncbi:MAG: TMEM175 family protein [Phenylobacterium sp.]